MKGTTPAGTRSEEEAARWVRDMFAQVSPRYDLLNHVLSWNIDRGWRKALLSAVEPVLRQRGALALDLCCGTGDVLLQLQQCFPNITIVGADFCHPMLVTAANKSHRAAKLFEGDVMTLPLRANIADAMTIAFGFRNLVNYSAGLRELYRVLKPGGVLAILEFSHPQSLVMRVGYGVYSRYVLPFIGGLLSGSREAYTYLPESIRKFPQAQELTDMMGEAGFASSRYQLLTGGVAALHVGYKRD